MAHPAELELAAAREEIADLTARAELAEREASAANAECDNLCETVTYLRTDIRHYYKALGDAVVGAKEREAARDEAVSFVAYLADALEITPTALVSFRDAMDAGVPACNASMHVAADILDATADRIEIAAVRDRQVAKYPDAIPACWISGTMGDINAAWIYRD